MFQAVFIRVSHNSVVGSKLSIPLWALLPALILATLRAAPAPPAHAQPPDEGFNPGANGDDWTPAVQADGKIVVGGEFTTLGGQTIGLSLRGTSRSDSWGHFSSGRAGYVARTLQARISIASRAG